MNYFIWNGINSLTYGVVAEKLPPPSRDAERVEKLTIPGRDGHMTLSDDTFDGQIRAVECGFLDRSLKDTVFAWLRGSGVVTFSNEPTRAYKARITEAIPMERLNDVFHSFIVTFDCQPFAYEATPTVHTLTSSGTITALGTRWSTPLIRVTGAGELTIDSTVYTIAATSGEAYVDIDSEIEECYYGTNNRNSKVSGGFPILTPGEHTITLGAGITQVDITGKYRWY